MDIFSVLLIGAVYLAGIITSTVSAIIRDVFSQPYRNWVNKREIKKENLETVKYWAADFCSSWELFKCKSIPSIDLEKDLVNSCKDIYSLISKNERDFQKNDIASSIKETCKKFINLHPQNDNCSGWSQGVESQIDEICDEFRKFKEIL